METINPINKNTYGHRYEGSKTDSGYGICSICGAIENTDLAAKNCLPDKGKYKILRIATSEICGIDDIVNIVHLRDGSANIDFFGMTDRYLDVHCLPKNTFLSKIG